MKIPVGLSNHHVHVTKEVGEILFGKDYELTVKRRLKQIGEYACEETIDIIINNRILEHVRLIGPYRKYTQVELLHKDCTYFDIEDIRKNSGQIENTHAFTLIGPKGKYESNTGAFVANNHIHLSKEDIEKTSLKAGDIIKIKTIDNKVIDNIFVKSDETCSLECHINKDEGELLGLENYDEIETIEE